MRFEVKNRLTGQVQFTAEIDCAEDASTSVKLGLAVIWAVKTGANLAGANLAGAYLAHAYLAHAYLARADFAGAYLADAYLADAYLARANLAGANLARADFAGANLAHANFAGADFAGANLADANFAGADLAGALKIDHADIPAVENIDAAILAAIDDGGTLDMSAWHGDDGWCGTTHCRAGWAIHLAGEKGKALADRVGSQLAGTLIYHASRPSVPSPDFFATNQDALADIRKCAAAQGYDEGRQP